MSMQKYTVKDVFKRIRNGLTVKNDANSGGLPITRIETISNGEIDIQRVGYSGIADGEKDDWFLEKGDVLFSHINSIAHIGKCAIYEGAPEKLIHGMNLLAFRPDSEVLFPKYALYLLRSPAFKKQLAKSIKPAVNQASVAIADINKIEVDIPPLEEQKRIAAILDKADSLRRKRAQAIALADEFLRATFLDMFGDPVTNPKGWPVAKLGDVTAFENGDRSSNYPSGDDLIESGVLFLSTKNIINKQLDLKFVQYISKEKFDSLSRGKPKFNDLIITLRGTLGNCCVYNLEDAAFINAQMMIIRPGPKVNSTFLQYFMTSNSINDLFQRIGQGAAVPQLTGKQLSELDVFVPEIDLQNAFESVVKKNNVLIGVMEKANVDLAKLGCMALV